MGNDIILNKKEIIERCIQRIESVYGNEPQHLNDLTKQDSIILNIQRACEATIDLAMHLVSEHKLGLPKTNREAFDLLEEIGIIETKLATSMKNMVGFRNIAVHDYQQLNLDILQSILDHHLKDFLVFIKRM